MSTLLHSFDAKPMVCYHSSYKRSSETYFNSKSVAFSKHAILTVKLQHYGALQMFKLLLLLEVEIAQYIFVE